ncbi:MAG TPA: hypothetical protein VGQ57_01125 [Polyangiaceae bacterium]|nr:hypothetical protein [Polyangiaceae bacterium]
MKRLLGLASLALMVGAASCGTGDDDSQSPTNMGGTSSAGAAGAGARGGGAGTAASLGGRAGRGGTAGASTGGGSPAGQSGLAGEGGGLDFDCVTSTCEQKALVGPCPTQAPAYYDACSSVGATCAYCGDSTSCPGETQGFILQCCADGTWRRGCYDDCVDPGAGGQGGEGGAGGPGGAAGAAEACDALLSMCCSTDDACPSGFECATAPDGGPSHGFAGVCKPRPPTSGQCWKDSDCPAGYECYDALYCECGRECNDEAVGICFKN